MNESRYPELLEVISSLSSKEELSKGEQRKLNSAIKKANVAKEKIKSEHAKKLQTQERQLLAKQGRLKLRDHAEFRNEIQELLKLSDKHGAGDCLKINRDQITDSIKRGVLSSWLIDALFQIGVVIKITQSKVFLLKSQIRQFESAFA